MSSRLSGLSGWIHRKSCDIFALVSLSVKFVLGEEGRGINLCPPQTVTPYREHGFQPV